MKLHHTGNYQAKREREYPPIGDQIDAIWKAFAYLESKGVVDFPVDVSQMMARVQGVKQKFPKVAK
jgi:hypothetical protein